MPERAIIDWTSPDGQPEARLYSRWAPPAHQIPALADFLSTPAPTGTHDLTAYRTWITEHAPHLITAVTTPQAPERGTPIDYRYTIQTQPLRVTATTHHPEQPASTRTITSTGELFAAAAQLLAGQALRIRALTEAYPRPPYAAYLADPDALEAAAVRHEASAAAAGWWPDDQPLLDPAHSDQ
ncbi:hypothetical protein AB0F20_10265 [Streptomyces goshikiensis]|uniref:hypothetical protein n=1 Tax=Streptomyces goshikiensis TaxID=1942 RepID=UPI00340DE6A4